MTREKQDNSEPNMMTNRSKQREDSLLDDALAKGTKPYISEQRLEANRWQLQQKLKLAKARKRAPLLRLPEFIFAQRGAIFAMNLTFVLGYSFALFNPATQSNINWSNNLPRVAYSVLQQPEQTILGLADNEQLTSDTQIIDLKMTPVSKDQRLKVSYTSVTQAQLDTALTDDRTLALLALAMKNDLADETRLQLAEVLKHHLDRRSVIDSLSYSLLNDPNPGVRMVAAESLAQLSSQQSVRNTLRFALAKDTNPGVRVSAFNGLIEYLDDPKTLSLLKNKAVRDSNLYIRNKTKELVKASNNRQQESI